MQTGRRPYFVIKSNLFLSEVTLSCSESVRVILEDFGWIFARLIIESDTSQNVIPRQAHWSITNVMRTAYGIAFKAVI